MRLNPDRARRVLQHSRALAADREHQAWLAAMTPEHRAIHQAATEPVFVCGECIKISFERVNAAITAMIARRAARATRQAPP